MRIQKLIFTISVLLIFATNAYSQSSKTGTLPSFIVVARDSSSLTDIDEDEFWSRGLAVNFPVNKTYIRPGDKSVSRIVDGLRKVSDKCSITQLLIIRGSASPEGPADNNRKLAHRRARALVDTLRHYVSLPDSLVKEKYIDEDYHGLRHLIVNSDKPYKKDVLGILDSVKEPKQIKKELMTIDGGRVWKSMLSEFFPELRASRVIIFVTPKTVEQPIADKHIAFPVPEANISNITPFPLAKATKALAPRRELLAVKTNLLFYGAWVPNYGYCPIPNIEIEYYPLRGHWTFGASFDMPWWQSSAYNDNTETSTGKDHKFFQVRQYQLLARWYTHDGGSQDGFHGFYIQPYVNLAIFGIGFKWDKGWMGEGLGGGVGLGYKLPLGRLRNPVTGFRTHASHWHLEFAAQFGVFGYQYDPYQYGCPKDGIVDGRYYYRYWGDASHFHKRDHHRAWFGPTRVGITLSYDLIYRSRKNSKKGGEL